MAVNQFPNAARLGNKDEMFAHLARLTGDASVAFIPRTWGPAELDREHSAAQNEAAMLEAAAGGAAAGAAAPARLHGLWVQKDPQRELGAGISLVHGVEVDSLASCTACVLQR